MMHNCANCVYLVTFILPVQHYVLVNNENIIVLCERRVHELVLELAHFRRTHDLGNDLLRLVCNINYWLTNEF